MKRFYQAPRVQTKNAFYFPAFAQYDIPCTEGDERSQDSPTANCYMLFNGLLEWDDARNACAILGQGAHLATIESAAENNIVDNLAGGSDVWVGGNDQSIEGTFVWVTGEPFIFTNWAAGEPNDNGGQDCLQVYGDGSWDDDSCAVSKPYVCERE